MKPRTRRTFALKVIIAYKVLKAAVGAVLAAWLSGKQHDALADIARLSADLADAHGFWSRIGAWIQARSTSGNIHALALVLWLDSVSTGIEGGLLWYGRPWAQWVVVASLALLVPFELWSLEHRPSAVKIAILLINVAVVVYLAAVGFTRSREGNES